MRALGLMMAAGRGELNAVDVVAMSSSTDALHFVCVIVAVLLVCKFVCVCVCSCVCVCLCVCDTTWMQRLNTYTHPPEKCVYSISHLLTHKCTHNSRQKYNSTKHEALCEHTRGSARMQVDTEEDTHTRGTRTS